MASSAKDYIKVCRLQSMLYSLHNKYAVKKKKIKKN